VAISRATWAARASASASWLAAAAATSSSSGGRPTTEYDSALAIDVPADALWGYRAPWVVVRDVVVRDVVVGGGGR